MKVLLFAFFMFVTASAFAEKTTFTKTETILPLGKNRIKNFLLLMKDPYNRKLVKMEEGAINLRELKQDNALMIDVGRVTYQLYWEDFNNDGKSEYVLVYLGSGSGQYSGVVEAFTKAGKKVIPLKFDEMVISNLFPGKDMSRFHGFLASPFAVKLNGKVYMRFSDKLYDSSIVTYKWEAGKISKENI